MDVRLLGPVEVWAAGRAVPAGPPRQRAVLAAIATDVGHPVPIDTIVDRVWGDSPPDRVRHALYVHMARVKVVIATAAAGSGTSARLARRSRGYVLDADPDCVDTHRFRALVARAGDPACSAAARPALLRQALDLWRGTPLGDLPGDWAAHLRAGWQQARLDAAIAWADAEIAAGAAGNAVPALTELAGAYPLVESLAAALMRALSAAGRPADALDRYRRIRTRLVEELGIEPGPELTDLHQTVLSGRSIVSPAGRMPVVPAQLPPMISAFTGRVTELATLDGWAAPSLVAIMGTAGVGKTALAVHWAHQVADRYPDGQLYVNLRGYGPATPMRPAEALRGFLDAYGVSAQRIPSSEADQAALYRSVLAGRRVLVLLDNARDAEQIRPLLPASVGCLTVVTSRQQLGGLVAVDGAQPLPLDVLPPMEARAILIRRLGPTRVAAEPDAVDEIVGRCGRLPLALTVAAARALLSPDRPLSTLAAELADHRSRLDMLGDDDPAADVRAVFSWSYGALDLAAARLFRLLGLYPGPDISAAAVTSLAGQASTEALAGLVDASLATRSPSGRVALHDLLRAYARELAVADGAEATAAVHRLLDHYLHTGCAAMYALGAKRRPLDLPASLPGVEPEGIDGAAAATSWFTAERDALLGAIPLAVDAGADRTAWQLGWAVTPYLLRRGLWPDLVTAMTTALSAARRAADVRGQAAALRDLARAEIQLGEYATAEDHLLESIEVAADDPVGRGYTRLALAYVHERLGRRADAVASARSGYDAFRESGDDGGAAVALNAIGWHEALRGNYEEALRCCHGALPILRRLDNRHGEAGTLDSLGYIHHQRAEYAEAKRYYTEAVELYRAAGDRHAETAVLTHLGEMYEAAGDPAAARHAWRRALAILDDLGHPDGDTLRLRLASG